MNTRIRTTLAIATMAILGNGLLAHQDHNHGSSQGTHTPGHAESGHDHGHDHSAGHDHHHAEVKSPDNLRDLWGEINVTREKLRLSVEGGQLDRIHGLDEVLSELLKALPEKSTELGQNERRRVDGQVNNLVQVLGRLHVQADADDLEGTRRQWQVFTRTFPLLARQYPEEISTHREPRPDREEEQPSENTQEQSPAEMDHDHGHSVSAAEPTLKLAVTSAEPLAVGREANVTVRLTKTDGSPVFPTDLVETHTEKVHLLINDMSLSDYHHKHPTATATPGEYAFTFTPSKPGPYRVWADLVPVATNAQEYAIADFAAPTKPQSITDRMPSTVAEVDGLRYTIAFETLTLKAGEAALGKLTITKSDGTPFNALEPVMGAYAHIVGFGEDLISIAHIHPMGAEPTKPTDRGDGELEFHLMPSKPGLMRLYAQVRIGGEDKFAPFTLEIQP